MSITLGGQSRNGLVRPVAVRRILGMLALAEPQRHFHKLTD